MSAYDTDGTWYPVCPHCGYEHKDAWEWKGDDGAQECDSCEALFHYARQVEITYTTALQPIDVSF